MSGPKRSTAGETAERAVAAYRDLAELGEQVEDEWLYVNDLVEAYVPSIRALAGDDPERLLEPLLVSAVDEAIAEVGLIADPHRAIDWLSTFPHVVALALGGDVDSLPDGGQAPAAAGSTARVAADDDAGLEDVEDSPFRSLLQRED